VLTNCAILSSGSKSTRLHEAGSRRSLSSQDATRWRKANGGRDIPIDQILEIQDSSKVKGPGLLFYTKDMPTAVLSNISTPLGIVNGAHGRAVGVVPNPDGMFMIFSYLNKPH